MRRWMLRAPFRAGAVVGGVPFAVGFALFLRIGADASWLEALVAGVVGGLLVGAATGGFVVWQQRELRQDFGDDYEEFASLPLFGRRTALERSRPEIREATARSLLRSKEKALRSRRWAVPLAVALLGLEVWMALTRAPHFWLFAAVFVGLLAAQFALPGWIDREVARLRRPRP